MRVVLVGVLTVATLVGCSGRVESDAGLDAGGRSDAASADVPDLDPSGIEAVLAAPDGQSDLEVRDVLVTFLRPGLGDDLPGFFVQARLSGPALIVQVDPATVGVSAGDRISFRVTEVETRISYKRPSEIADVVVHSSGNDVSPLVQDVTGLADLVTDLPSYAHELVAADLTIRGPAELAGAGFSRAVVSTQAILEEPRLQLRLPESLWSSYPLVEGCTLRVAAVPLWAFNDVAQFSAWDARSLVGVGCP